MPKTYTIAQVLATPEGQYVSAEIFAVLTNPKPPRAKGPWSATLTDSTGSILGKFWGSSIEHWNGKRIKLSGAGMQRKAYQNVPELSVGQKADVSFAGAPGTAAQEEDQIPGDPYTPQAPFRPTPSQTRHVEQPTLKAQGTPVHGATVGGALARAVDIWLAINGSAAAWNDGSASEVEQITRDLVAIQQRVETGESVPF